MKGKYLNDKRYPFLQSIEKLLDEAQHALNAAKADYHRFDEYDDYREDFAREYIMKMTKAELAIIEVTELLNN